MQAYVLETALGQALIPEGRHVYIGLNPRVATLARIEDVEDGKVFFRKENLSHLDFANLYPQLDPKGKLYPQTEYGNRITLPIAVIAKIMAGESYWESSEGERALRGERLSKRNIKSAKKFLKDCKIILNDKEINALLSPESSAADWPWEKFGRLWFEFRNSNPAILYSEKVKAIEAAIANGEERFEIDGSYVELPVRFSDYAMVAGKRGEKREGEAETNVLTLEDHALPGQIKDIYSDYWKLAQDCAIIKKSAELLLFYYLVQTYGKDEKPARQAAETVGKSLMGESLQEENLADARLLIHDLAQGRVGEFYSAPNFLKQSVYQVRQLESIMPPDFMELYKNKIRLESGSLSVRLAAFFKMDRAKRKEMERKCDEDRARLERAEKTILEKYSMAKGQPKDFLGLATEAVMRRNPGFRYEGVVKIMSSTPERYLGPQDFSLTASRYKIPLIEFVAQAMFSS